MHTLMAAADLAQSVYERNKKQYAAQAVSRASLDADAADLKGKQAEIAQQEALINKKTIRAPFGAVWGSLCECRTVFEPGDKIVTLKTLDPIYIDFFMPQQDSPVFRPVYNRLVPDTYPDKIFKGKISAIIRKFIRIRVMSRLRQSWPTQGTNCFRACMR